LLRNERTYIIWESIIEEATEDGSNVIPVKLALSLVEGTGKICEFFV